MGGPLPVPTRDPDESPPLPRLTIRHAADVDGQVMADHDPDGTWRARWTNGHGPELCWQPERRLAWLRHPGDARPESLMLAREVDLADPRGRARWLGEVAATRSTGPHAVGVTLLLAAVLDAAGVRVTGDETKALEQDASPVARLLAEFLAASTSGIRWLVDGMAVEGGLVAILGRPESFKSTAALQLGLSVAGGSLRWLGAALGPARPFVYVTAEKSGDSVREKFRRLAASLPPTEPVYVSHRAGVMFGNAAWRELIALVQRLGSSVVVLDTLASLAGPGFDENSGKDMSVALGAIRELCDHGATVFLVHHPAKHGEGAGGIRLRGHTSLWGEVDAVLEFVRPDRERPEGTIRVEPKDGDFRLVRFEWEAETFLVQPRTAVGLSAVAVAEVVDALSAGGPVTSDQILKEFPGHGRSAVLARLGEAVHSGLVGRKGKGPTTRYEPPPQPDDAVSDGWAS